MLSTDGIEFRTDRYSDEGTKFFTDDTQEPRTESFIGLGIRHGSSNYSRIRRICPGLSRALVRESAQDHGYNDCDCDSRHNENGTHVATPVCSAR